MKAIGIDIGGTHIRGAIFDLDDPTAPPTIRARADLPRGAVGALDEVARLADDLIDQAKRADIELDGIGIGIAGHLDLDGRLRLSANTPGLVGIDLPAWAERFTLPTVFENDANCVVLATHRLIAPESPLTVAVTLGTGIGGGIVANGALFRGRNGMAGEVGHMVVDTGGPRCACGANGCWEALASGTALTRMVQAVAVSGGFPTLGAEGRQQMVGEDLSPLIEAGDPDALKILDEYGNRVALGITNLIQLLDPDTIVIGGGVVAIGKPLMAVIDGALAASTAGVDLRSLQVVVAALGPDTGMLGAAMVVADQKPVSG